MTFFALLSLSVDGSARSSRVGDIPHASDFGCETCHLNGNNGLNDFGFDSFTYTQNGSVDWSQLAMVDSDRDGYTNGVELGDPDGNWNGGAAPSGPYSHPGDRNSTLCGSGSLEGEEECEGTNLNGETCDSLDLGGGMLGCTDACVYDTSTCGSCGDGTVQNDNEECDGDDLQGATCEMMGFDGGSMTCTGCRLDTSNCTGGEEDVAETATCGDGVIEGNELCDGETLGGASCTDFEYAGGTIACAADCVYDTSGCTGQSDTGTSDNNDSGSQTPPDDTSSDGGTTGDDPSTAEGEMVNDMPEGGVTFEGRVCSVAFAGKSTAAPVILLLAMILVVRLRRRDDC